MDKDEITPRLADAGWITDGSFSEHPFIGESRELCMLVHRSTWESDQPACKLYDAAKHLSY